MKKIHEQEKELRVAKIEAKLRQAKNASSEDGKDLEAEVVCF